MISRQSLAVLFACAALWSCANGPMYGSAETSQVIAANYYAADMLTSGRLRPISKDAPIIVSTIVKLENLGASSNLGRLVSEQISSRLTQLGYAIPELKLRESIFVRSDQGELILSRDIHQIASSHHAQAIVAGTYAIGANVVYIHVELIDATTAHAISAYDYYIPLIAPVKGLLGFSEPRF